MADELRRAFKFMASADMLGTSVEPALGGLAVRFPELPLRQDSNYLLVDRTEVPAVELAQEVERLALRAVFVREPSTGVRLEREFETLGWSVHRGLVMAHRRAPAREPGPAPVSDVGERALQPLRRRTTLSYPWGTPELADQLLQAKALIARRVETHFLAVTVDGEIAAYADLYLADHTAQIEDVFTVPEHRNRGYASALVLDALDRAREARADLVFLAADADDWPRLLYERLGFDVIGGYSKFFT